MYLDRLEFMCFGYKNNLISVHRKQIAIKRVILFVKSVYFDDSFQRENQA